MRRSMRAPPHTDLHAEAHASANRAHYQVKASGRCGTVALQFLIHQASFFLSGWRVFDFVAVTLTVIGVASNSEFLSGRYV